MKTKLITTLTALLMLVGISAQAQTDNQTRANAESTDLEGDLNHDGKVNVADVTYLVNLIMKNKSEAKDGTYYWYIGVDNPTSISDIQTDNTKPGWHEIGTSLSGFVHDMNNQANWLTLVENATSEDDMIDFYIVVPNEISIVNGIGTDLTTNGQLLDADCNISGYKAYKYYKKSITVKGIIIRESNESTNDNFYWYIGAGNPSSISNIQTNNTVGGWHEIGSSLSGFVLNTDTNPVHISDTRVPYYIIIPNNLHIYDGLGTNIETLTFDSVACNISGYKAFKWNAEKDGGGFNGVRNVIGIIIK